MRRRRRTASRFCARCSMSLSASGSGSEGELKGGGRAAPAPRSGGRDKVAHAIAVWFGCGHVPYMPGHAGTIGAIPLYLLVRPHGPVAVAAAALVVTLVGIWASG